MQATLATTVEIDGSDKPAAVAEWTNEGAIAHTVTATAVAGFDSGSLAPGESIYVFTDGVTEAADGEGELFAEARLEAVLRAGAGCSTALQTREHSRSLVAAPGR